MFGFSPKSQMDSMVCPYYSKDVLVGNWRERRYVMEQESNAILPGLHTNENCEQHRTLNQDTYTDAAFKGDEVKSRHDERRMESFRNCFKSSASQVVLQDRPEMGKNYTTTNTLFFEVLPKDRQQWCQQGAAKNKKEIELTRVPQFDTLQGYGNLTKTGFNTRRFCKYALDSANCRYQTTYSASYDPGTKSKPKVPSELLKYEDLVC
ncbi:uncharacterized protein LOC115627322 [Scaptodrosophila lebanonensis]|uniref:Uncharacterized protein LOC115627322 n=1 Tax=Drosophila lebanonensis TaxID=7225 RepID=A0A6J2TTC5_DROLE|nr:uncharacterized protein LOC115627322 [Scaptodrosophila lebanonensis]